ncbi:MrcB family domain-containing protein [Alkalihalophilus marmarensis]|uniref:MrcB family domain-containing protein n=1 Tax=Alkalihalophilus marmarensis TaxID=521377 RepID=UPI002E1EE6B7|nr:DUF3578 domain-containing protein [Alkalihalophilus marmarensis]
MFETLLRNLVVGHNKLDDITDYQSKWYIESIEEGHKFKIKRINKISNEIKDNHLIHISLTKLNELWIQFLKEKEIDFTVDKDEAPSEQSFILSLFSLFPFVEFRNNDGRFSIKYEYFLTDELPREKEKLLEPLEQNNDISLIYKQQYFKTLLFVLENLGNESKYDKRSILINLGMKIVRNSVGENLMKQSVAERRTSIILTTFQHLNIIDENYVVKNSFNKEHLPMPSNLSALFKKVLNEYLTSRQQPFGKHEMGSLVRREIRGEIEQLPFIDENYSVVGSVGQGNWAVVPWVAIMNEKITSSTQRGYYIVYLFSEDMQRLYLTFAQGVTETTREQMRVIKEEIRSTISMDSKVKKDDGIDLGQSKRARDYVESVAAYIEYQSDNLPVEEELVSDLHKMISYYEEYMAKTEVTSTNYLKQGEDNSLVQEQHIPLSIPEVVDHIHSYITAKGFYYEKQEVTNLYLSLKTKPFVILSGISGTGKTMMVRWFAESVGATEENGRFALIPVRPDWSDGSDLLGYVDIKGDFKEGPLTNVLKSAMQDPMNPYFVLLDEMNLARVEHYFSDLLSVMESRQWKDGEQVTSNVLPTEITGEELYLPSNVYLIGTVNMDETTHPFSKKVLDRANTIEFNRVQLDHLGFLKEQNNKSAMLMHNDRFVSHYLQLKDLYKDKPELIEEVTSILVKVNNILQFNGSHVGYRVRDEICFYIAYSQMHELFSFDEAIDHCLLQKILPRLAGSDSRVERVLKNLYTLFTNKEINDIEEVAPTDITDATYPKSTEKVVEMLRRLEDDGFTSFWLNS